MISDVQGRLLTLLDGSSDRSVCAMRSPASEGDGQLFRRRGRPCRSIQAAAGRIYPIHACKSGPGCPDVPNEGSSKRFVGSSMHISGKHNTRSRRCFLPADAPRTNNRHSRRLGVGRFFRQPFCAAHLSKHHWDELDEDEMMTKSPRCIVRPDARAMLLSRVKQPTSSRSVKAAGVSQASVACPHLAGAS